MVIRLAFVGGSVCCPECNKQCARHDTAPERTWRHLDTMQFKEKKGKGVLLVGLLKSAMGSRKQRQGQPCQDSFRC
ncbi:transposase family protein [Roseiconus lacunae]|uniref:transposase family protein n=1 Tax=Roseiconus lacunae TaxID=2605694 RepID=UPI003D9EFD8A